jgi:hypothetical protein
MKPHQERVVVEKSELDVKIKALTAFTHGTIFPTLDPAEQMRLKVQLDHMTAYSNVLGERIAAFPKGE